MKIREAAAADLNAISELSNQLGYQVTPEQVNSRMAEIWKDKSQIVLVAELDGKVLGWVHLCGLKRLLSAPFVEICGLIVEQNHRSAGLGSTLVKHAEEWATSNAYTMIRVRSNVTREKAVSFYSKNGYTRSKQQNVFVRTFL
jgi:N-acetylglutamate synthase-like GNAT family acetyltransferase